MEPSRPRPACEVPASFDYEAERRAARSRTILIGIVAAAVAIIILALTG